MSDISDLSPKAQELYHKIMSGKYLTEQGNDIPLPMRRYFCQELHLVRGRSCRRRSASTWFSRPGMNAG